MQETIMMGEPFGDGVDPCEGGGRIFVHVKIHL